MKEREVFRCIAVDMGASNIRIMEGRVSPSSVDCREVYRFPNSIVEKEGHVRWDMDNILGGIIEGIRRISPGDGRISGIGVDSWGVDFILLDAEGNPLECPVAYRDKRTEGMEEKWLKLMSREETFRRSGINFYIFNTLFQLLSLKDSELLDDAEGLLFLPSYVLSLLCGKGMNELTISSTSQMLNPRTAKWDPLILKHLGIGSELPGEICCPGTILGKITHPELDLPDTEAIAVCAHDTASAVVAVPFEDLSSVFISTGTWCIVGMELDEPVLSPEALENGFTNERGFGESYRFLKNIVGLWLVQGLMKSLPVAEDYTEIESLAGGYQGNVPLIDPGDPLFYNPADMKDAFDEYLHKTGQGKLSGPGGYFRAAYDSLAYSFRSNIEQIERMTGRTITTIHLIGGGCQSAYLSRHTALICRRRVISGPIEAATIGNILVQAMTMNVLPDLKSARQLVRDTMLVADSEPAEPQPEQEASYKKFLELTSGKVAN
jgi:rhamnulokinase